MGACGSSPRNHGTHGQAISLVRIHDVVQELRGRCRRDPLLVPQLVEAAQPSEVALPVHAIRRSSRHRSQKIGGNLNALLDRLRACKQSSSLSCQGGIEVGMRIHSPVQPPSGNLPAPGPSLLSRNAAFCFKSRFPLAQCRKPF